MGVSHGRRSSAGVDKQAMEGRRVDGFTKRSHEVWEKQGFWAYVSRVWGVCAVGVEGMSGRGAGDSVRGRGAGLSRTERTCGRGEGERRSSVWRNAMFL